MTEFTEGAAWTTGDGATVALTGRSGVTWQRLQFQAGFVTLFFRLRLVVDDGLQRGRHASVHG
eukprot:gene27345-34053_t